MSQTEKEKMMLQHRLNEYQRKAEQESEKRRNVENEGKLPIRSHCRNVSCNDPITGDIEHFSNSSSVLGEERVNVSDVQSMQPCGLDY